MWSYAVRSRRLPSQRALVPFGQWAGSARSFASAGAGNGGGRKQGGNGSDGGDSKANTGLLLDNLLNHLREKQGHNSLSSSSSHTRGPPSTRPGQQGRGSEPGRHTDLVSLLKGSGGSQGGRNQPYGNRRSEQRGRDRSPPIFPSSLSSRSMNESQDVRKSMQSGPSRGGRDGRAAHHPIPPTVRLDKAPKDLNALISWCCRRHRLDQAEILVRRAKNKAPVSSESINLILSELNKEKNYWKTIDLYRALEEKGAKLTAIASASYVEALCNWGELELAKTEKERLEQEVPESSKPYLTIALIEGTIAAKRFQEGDRLYIEATELDTSLAVAEKALRAVFKGYLAALDYDTAINVLKQMAEKGINISEDVLFLLKARYEENQGTGRFYADTAFDVLKENKVPIKEAHIVGVMKLFAKEEREEEVRRMMAMMEKLPPQETSVAPFKALLEVYSQQNKMKKAETVLYFLQKSGRYPTAEMFDPLFQKYCEDGNVNAVKDLIIDLQDKKLKPTELAWNHILELYQRTDSLKEAEEAKKAMITMNAWPPLTFVYASAIKQCCDRGDMKGAEEHVQNMRLNNVPVTLEFFNVLLRGYARQGRAVAVEGVLKELEKEGLEPDVTSYNAVVLAYSISEKFRTAIAKTKEMEEKGFKVTSKTVEGLLRGSAKVKDPLLAEYFQRLHHEHEGRTMQLRELACQAHAAQGDWEYIESEVKQPGPKPTIRLLNSLIEAHARAGNVEKARLVAKKLKAVGSQADTGTYNALILAHCLRAKRGDEPKEPQEIKLPKKGKAQKTVEKKDDLAEAELLYERMLENKVSPDVHTYTPLIEGYARRGDMEGAERWLLKLRKVMFTPLPEQYAILVRGYGALGDVPKAEKAVERMVAAGVKQNAGTSAALLEAFCLAQGPEQAVPVLKGLIDYREPLDSEAYTVVIRAFLNKGQPERAIKLYDDYIRRGYDTDHRILGPVLASYLAAEKEDMARAIVLDMAKQDRYIAAADVDILLNHFLQKKEFEEAVAFYCDLRSADILVKKTSTVKLLEACLLRADSDTAARILETVPSFMRIPDDVLGPLKKLGHEGTVSA